MTAPRRAEPLIEIDLAGEVATDALAAKLAPLARAGDVLALWGGLGVGKTAFARAFVRARGNPREEVPSPTFTLVQIYEPKAAGEPAVYHFDLYRLNGPEEAYELGIEEAFVDGISLIEWPERLGSLLPRCRLDITLIEGASETRRHARLHGRGSWRQRLQGTPLD